MADGLLEARDAYRRRDWSSAAELYEAVQDLGRRHADVNLVAAGTIGEGRILVKQGHAAAGVALLDESFVMLLTEDLSPEWAGDVYCNLMAAAHELLDIERTTAWTEATRPARRIAK